MVQLTQLPDQQLLHLIGRLEGTIGDVRQVEDALQPDQQLGLLPESPDELGFLRSELGAAEVLLQPGFIGASG